MTWTWVLLLLILFVMLPLLRPIWVRLELFPLLVHVSWVGFGFNYSEAGTELLLWGFKFSLQTKEPKAAKLPPEPSSKSPKPKKAKKKTEFQKPSLALAQKLWALGLVQRLLRRLKLLGLGLWQAIGFHYFSAKVGQLDCFQTGVLGAIFASLPQDDRVDLQPSFIGEQHLSLVVSIRIGKVLWELIKLLCFFPYLTAWKAYKCIQV